MSSYRDVNVAALLRTPDVRLLSFTRDVAFARNFRYLTPVRLTEGLLDLKADLPREETTLMAPAALLVCRDDAASRGWWSSCSRWPARCTAGAASSTRRCAFPPAREWTCRCTTRPTPSCSAGSPSCRACCPTGPCAGWCSSACILLPLVAVWVPLFKILPWVLRWRGNRILERHYALLRDAEAGIDAAAAPEALRAGIARLEVLREQIEGLARRLPLQHQRDAYQCRVHVSLVLAEARDRLRELEGAAAS